MDQRDYRSGAELKRNILRGLTPELHGWPLNMRPRVKLRGFCFAGCVSQRFEAPGGADWRDGDFETLT